MRVIKRITAVMLIASFVVVLFPQRAVTMKAATDASAVQWLADNHIMTDEFDRAAITADPGRSITRQEYIALLMSAIGKKGTEAGFRQITYADKDKTSESFKKYIAGAEELSIIRTETHNNKKYFYPQINLTRQMGSYYLAAVTGIHIDLEPESILDYKKAAVNLRPYIMAVLAANLLAGRTDTVFDPIGEMSWTEAAELIKRAWEMGYLRSQTPEIMAGGMEHTPADMLFSRPSGITMGEDKTSIYISDSGNNRIMALKNGRVEAVTGQAAKKDLLNQSVGGYRDGTLAEAMFLNPMGIRSIKDGLLVADTGNSSIRLVNLKTGQVSTYAGKGIAGRANGSREKAEFMEPQGIEVAGDGTVYVADTGNHCIRKIDAQGNVTTYAGSAGREGLADGNASTALFNRPTDIVYSEGAVYVADAGNQRIRKIQDGIVTTIAGSGMQIYDGTEADIMGGYQDGEALKARFNGPVRLTLDQEGTMYISDSVNGMIRKLKDGNISTLAGFGKLIADRNGQESVNGNPAGLFVSGSDGKLYVADSFLNLICRWNTAR